MVEHVGILCSCLKKLKQHVIPLNLHYCVYICLKLLEEKIEVGLHLGLVGTPMILPEKSKVQNNVYSMSVLVKTYMSLTCLEKFTYKMRGGLDDPQWALHFSGSVIPNLRPSGLWPYYLGSLG